jgi:hypothetical protein
VPTKLPSQSDEGISVLSKRNLDSRESNSAESVLFHKHEIDGKNQATESGKVIPMQRLAFEEYGGKYRKDNQRNHFLYHLELHQRKWASIAGKTDAVGWHLTSILEQSDTP